MFERIARDLIEGRFICQVADAPGYDYLVTPGHVGQLSNADEIDSLLRKLGMRLATTQSKGAFFAVHARLDEEAMRTAKATFSEVKNTIRPLTAFFELILRAYRTDSVIAIGEKIDANQLMGLIAQNPSLTESLRMVTNMSKQAADGSDRDRLKKVFAKFKKDGYLLEVNSAKEIFQITGKLEYYQDVIQFLIQNDKISEEDQDFEKRTDDE